MSRSPIKKFIAVERDKKNRHIAKYKKDKEYVKKLRVPPGYSDVRINKNKKAPLVWTAVDSKDRLQYRYSDAHKKKANQRKYKKLIETGKSLIVLRKWIHSKLNDTATQKELEFAATMALVDRCHMRPGESRYTNESGHQGATTLTRKNFKKGVLKWIGKSGVAHTKKIDPQLAVVLPRTLGKTSSKILNKNLNHNFKITCKDIRTFHANSIYLSAIQNDKTQKQAIKFTASQLGHNPSTSKNNYLSPKILKITKKSQLPKVRRGGGLSLHEKMLLTILQK